MAQKGTTLLCHSPYVHHPSSKELKGGVRSLPFPFFSNPQIGCWAAPTDATHRINLLNEKQTNWKLVCGIAGLSSVRYWCVWYVPSQGHWMYLSNVLKPRLSLTEPNIWDLLAGIVHVWSMQLYSFYCTVVLLCMLKKCGHPHCILLLHFQGPAAWRWKQWAQNHCLTTEITNWETGWGNRTHDVLLCISFKPICNLSQANLKLDFRRPGSAYTVISLTGWKMCSVTT